MAKRGGFPGGMPGNMNNLMKQAQKMQKQMETQQAELEAKQFSAAAGGGVVEVTVTGKREVTKVKIDPEAVDPDDVEMIEDLIMVQFYKNGVFSQLMLKRKKNISIKFSLRQILTRSISHHFYS